MTSPAGAGTTIQVLIPWTAADVGGPGDLMAAGTVSPG
jgi:hypothetical protein